MLAPGFALAFGFATPALAQISRRAMTDDTNQPRQLAIVRTYHDLRKALAARSDELGLSRLELDHHAGLASGHSGKLLGGRAVKKFGIISLEVMLAALGVHLVLVQDDS